MRFAWLAGGLVALVALGSAEAQAGPNWDEIPARERDAWQRSIGLEAGIAMMHCVQPLSAAAGEIDFRPKHYVAIAGCAVYGANTVGLAYRQKWSLWVNIVGPIVGMTAVGTGWALNAAGVIEAEIRPDVPQLVGGVLQAWAWLEAFGLLRAHRRRAESLLHSMTLTPTTHGAALRATW